jgi:hypothetical protein
LGKKGMTYAAVVLIVFVVTAVAMREAFYVPWINEAKYETRTNIIWMWSPVIIWCLVHLAMKWKRKNEVIQAIGRGRMIYHNGDGRVITVRPPETTQVETQAEAYRVRESLINATKVDNTPESSRSMSPWEADARYREIIADQRREREELQRQLDTQRIDFENRLRELEQGYTEVEGDIGYPGTREIDRNEIQASRPRKKKRTNQVRRSKDYRGRYYTTRY